MFNNIDNYLNRLTENIKSDNQGITV